MFERKQKNQSIILPSIIKITLYKLHLVKNDKIVKKLKFKNAFRAYKGPILK